MTDIKWGPAIAVDGKRPEWLGGGLPLKYEHKQIEDKRSVGPVDYAGWSKGDWHCVTAIRLPADHPHYRQTEEAIPEGMKAWHGGDAAPADWAGLDSDTLLRNGYRVKGGYRWTHKSAAHPDGTAATDIIAYTPKATPQEALIDWSGELEATDGNGKVWPIKIVDYGEWVEVTLPKGFAPVEGHCVDIANDNWGYEKNRNGKANDWLPVLRNVPQPTPQADTKPDLTAEQRAVALARRLNEHDYAIEIGSPLWPLLVEAAAIVALLPEPVDPDLIEAREMEAEGAEANGFHDYAAKVRAGDEDNGPVRHRYEGIKRGRALALAGEKEA